MKCKQLLFSFFVFFSSSIVIGQELNCSVAVRYENVRQTDPQLFKQLEERIQKFMNETAWTKDRFRPEERINCDILLNILSEANQNTFNAVATIKSSRPVYNTTYNSVILDVIDNDFEFVFDPYTQFLYRENDFANNLTSSLAFYAYTIIGLDYDTFILNGGKKYHKKAQEIVQLGSTQPFPGWTQSNTNNKGNISKFWISNNLTEQRFDIFKTQLYQYHRNGLDNMYEDPSKSWKVITSVSEELAKFNRQNRNTPFMYVFFNAKAQEITNIMQKASSAQKTKVANNCLEIDPNNSKLYKKLQK